MIKFVLYSGDTVLQKSEHASIQEAMAHTDQVLTNIHLNKLGTGPFLVVVECYGGPSGNDFLGQHFRADIPPIETMADA